MTLALLAVAWLLTYLLHSTILLGGGWILTAAGVVRTPVAKNVLWKVCLVGGLLTATVQAASQDRLYGRHFWLPGSVQSAPRAGPVAVPQWAAAAVPAVRVAAERSRSPLAPVLRPAASTGGSVAAGALTTTSDPRPAGSSPALPGWPVMLLGVWLLGAAALVGRLAIRWRRFCRRLGERDAGEARELLQILASLRAAAGVRRPVRLAVSAQLPGPVAMGLSRICLPEQVLTALTPAEQRAVLAHELGHLVRRDPAWLAAAVLVESLFFLQPLNRLARRRIQESAEYLCDDWAVQQTGGSLTLARCLAEVACWIQASRREVPVSGMAANRSHLVARVQRLVEGVEPRAVRSLRLALPVAALALATVAFAAPGVLPPCTADQPQAPAARAAWGAAPRVAYQGAPRTWATIREGRLVVFRTGFAPRITGQGRIGIRRGGRAIELMDDQQLTVNGRPVTDDGELAVRESDTVRIVDGRGTVVWSLEPVRVPTGPWSTRAGVTAEVDPADAAQAAVDAPDAEGDSFQGPDDLDAADLTEASRDVAHLGADLGRSIQAAITPQIAQIQRVSVRLATDLAPRLAEMGERIAAEVGPAIAAAFNDSADCDSGSAAKRPVPQLRRGMDGRKRFR